MNAPVVLDRAPGVWRHPSPAEPGPGGSPRRVAGEGLPGSTLVHPRAAPLAVAGDEADREAAAGAKDTDRLGERVSGVLATAEGEHEDDRAERPGARAPGSPRARAPALLVTRLPERARASGDAPSLSDGPVEHALEDRRASPAAGRLP